MSVTWWMRPDVYEPYVYCAAVPVAVLVYEPGVVPYWTVEGAVVSACQWERRQVGQRNIIDHSNVMQRQLNRSTHREPANHDGVSL